MNISYAWIRSLLPGLTSSPQELADMLAMQGAPVDEITDIGGPLHDIRIARVIEAGQHPNADRLKLCRVDAGTGEELQVVCGAPNARTGGVYPFAPVGAHLPGDVVIRKSKIRGSESQGMLCSARELGLGKDHDGIMDLPQDTPIGASLIDVLQLDDSRIVVDVTPNRPDLLSHIGVAREIGAATGIEMKLGAVAESDEPVFDVTSGANAGDTGGLNVEVRDAELCPRYMGLIIRGVKVGPSPAWLSGRLRTIGLRPISNVVDATNYILHELGQPLHAFDLAKTGPNIVVRRAGTGATITTLDGTDRKLTPDMLVIADQEQPIAIAGVMGGANSEVDDTTTDIVLECALFQPASIRATRRLLGLSTDASYRFERGVDPDMMEIALRRAAQLITAVAGGTVAPAAVDVDTRSKNTGGRIELRLARVAQVLGVPFNAQQVVQLLSPLGFTVTRSGDVLDVRVPGHRGYDVSREEDLIEEIARRHGYDNFPDELRAFRPTSVPDDQVAMMEDRLRDRMIALGLLESRTLAFAPESNGDVALLLPLSNTEAYLRNALVPALLRRAEFNFSRGQRSIRLYEIGTAFLRNTAHATPDEERRIAAVVTGTRAPEHWSGDTQVFDVRDLQGLAAQVAAEMSFDVALIDAGDAETPGTLPAWADVENAWRITNAAGQTVGYAGRVKADAIDAPAWADPAYALEVTIPATAGTRNVAFRPLPAYPAVERDLALLVPHAMTAATVIGTIRGSAGPLLEAAYPFDVYRGKGIDASLRSLAMRLRFRAADRTLTDEEVDRALVRVLHRLKEDHGIQLRG
jgi:phenylalanyl-tRNA synthetase beta chain